MAKEMLYRLEKKKAENITKYVVLYANRLWKKFHSVYNQNADISWHTLRMCKQRTEKQKKV